ncbi:putative ribonuclease H-like domain-containing protein, partial [Tanacetum coccineum]
MPSLEETGIFDDVYDDREVGAEADRNNLELLTVVSPIPITRLHKYHPKEQIIGDLNLVTQTRRMIIFSEENAMVSYINKQRRTNHNDYLLICLFSVSNRTQEGDSSFNRSKLDRSNARGASVFRNKKDKRGRLVSQGYTQEEGINYDEVFAPVARIEAIRVPFLYGTIEDKVYVCQPLGFEDPHFPDKVYKVEKALYGLHQAPRAWYETLSTYLLENGFRRGTIDKTLFIKKDKGDILYVKQKDDGIFISHDKYVVDILNKFDFSSVKTASTPIEPNKALIKDAEAEDVDVHLYRSMIGSLMYLTASRPDIMFAVC